MLTNSAGSEPLKRSYISHAVNILHSHMLFWSCIAQVTIGLIYILIAVGAFINPPKISFSRYDAPKGPRAGRLLLPTRQIPAADGTYGLVVLLGNSFGHGSDDDDLQMLQEVYRKLRPGGVFVIDYVDGAWMRENFTPSGWEWLGRESHFLSGSDSEKQLLVLRERELSADTKRLASREIVIDLQNPPTVHQDLFYAVQLYDIPEMEELLRKAGLHIQIQESSPVTVLSGNSQLAADMGMMEHRQLVTAVKPDLFDPQDVDVHPSLASPRLRSAEGEGAAYGRASAGGYSDYR
ncbi:hypothetical protein BJX65DRAFT_301384 [Aspergillus insuetus]